MSLWKERGLHRIDTITAESLPSPDSYPALPLAVERLKRAATQNQRVTIVGDYDCDGITSTALLVRALRRLGLQPRVRLPHRLRDGYGLTVPLVREVLAAGTDLLITVDTGVVAVEAVAVATAAGVDVLIIDHHHLPPVLPDALAILHPATIADRLGGAPSAAGVSLALVRGLHSELQDEDLALAMLGTVADVVPLTGENRTLVELGLRAMRRLKGGPLALLRDAVTDTPETLTAQDVAFRIAPRINAAGRLDDPTLALTALLEGGAAVAALEELNMRRQEQTQQAVARALEQIEGVQRLPPLLSAVSPDYHPGVIGLIAAKLTDRFGRPSLVAAVRGDVCTASLRSTPRYHITEGLTSCADLLTSFGGHAQAGGCSFPLSAAPAVLERLSAHVAGIVPESDLVPEEEVSAALQPADLTLEFHRALSTFEPFGAGNAEPQFLVPAAKLSGVRRVGGEGRHLQARLGETKVIGFGLGHLEAEAQAGPLDLLARVGVDSWNGRTAVQLFLKDLRSV